MDLESRLLNGEQLQTYDGKFRNLLPISEEKCLWKPQDEAFLKEQQMVLEKEFENDSGFKSTEEVGSNGFFDRNEARRELPPCFDDHFVKTFRFPDGPQMTSSARSSMESSSPRKFNGVRLSLGIGPNHQIRHLGPKELFTRDTWADDSEDQFSTEMISMARRTSIDGNEDPIGCANSYREILPIEMDETTKVQRKEILVTLVASGILSIEDAYIIVNNPRRFEMTEEVKKESYQTSGNRKNSVIENYLWMPDDFDDCFVDYINFKCADTTSFRKLLESPVPVAVNDAEAFAQVMSREAKVKDLIIDARNSGMYYSFCLSRAVFSGSTQHCSRCRICVDWRYWHCESCDKCSYGLSYGKCEHCSASPKNISNTTESSDRTNIFSHSGSYQTDAKQESVKLGLQSVESSVDNLSELGESKSHVECYCGDAACQNLYCSIIQDTFLNGPFLEERNQQDLFRSRETSFVLGNRSSRSRTSESSGSKSLSLHKTENLVQYYSTPSLEMSFMCHYINQRNMHSNINISMLSKSL